MYKKAKVSIVSLYNLSNNYRGFLSNLNSNTIPKTTIETIASKEWREAMKVKMDAREKNKLRSW